MTGHTLALTGIRRVTRSPASHSRVSFPTMVSPPPTLDPLGFLMCLSRVPGLLTRVPERKARALGLISPHPLDKESARCSGLPRPLQAHMSPAWMLHPSRARANPCAIFLPSLQDTSNPISSKASRSPPLRVILCPLSDTSEPPGPSHSLWKTRMTSSLTVPRNHLLPWLSDGRFQNEKSESVMSLLEIV